MASNMLFESDNTSVSAYTVTFVFSQWTNIPIIKGIPEIPGARPFIGHLHLLGGLSGLGDATVWSRWSQDFGWDIFQLRFGSQRVVVVNSYDSIKELWTGSSSAALASRPTPWAFDHIVGTELGNEPWTNRCRKQRGAALKSVAAGKWSMYHPLLDRDSRAVIKLMIDEGQSGEKSLGPSIYLDRIGMNLGFTVTYGKTLEEFGGMDFLKGFIKEASKLTDIRYVSTVWLDYVPLLRYLPDRTVKRAKEGAQNRQTFIDRLYDSLKQDLKAGNPSSCIAAQLLLDETTQLNEEDIKQICLAMLQGSAETIAATLTCGFGVLSADARGLQIQDDAYTAIIEQYGSASKAFDNAFEGTEIPIITALYKEMMRVYCVVPFSQPRKTLKDVYLKDGTIIPAGTTMFMNAENGNHDLKFYGDDADIFNPYRWLDPSSALHTTSLPHFGYGAGARVCPAMKISNHILHALIIRFIVTFRITASADKPPVVDGVSFNTSPGSGVARPAYYEAYYKPRDLRTNLD